MNRCAWRFGRGGPAIVSPAIVSLAIVSLAIVGLAIGLVLLPQPVASASVGAGKGGAMPGPAAVADDEQAVCDRPEARQFDFWIGEWDVVNRNRTEDSATWYVTGRATDRVYAVAGGCAIVEHWRGEAFGTHILGYSVRAVDEESGKWKLVLLWPQPGRTRFGVRYGSFRHGRGLFSKEVTGPDGATFLSRFVFSDVGSDSLRWESNRSTDGGRTWSARWIMEFRRRDPIRDAGLWNGPTAGTHRCPGPEHRAFDEHVGEWRGIRRSPGDREGIAVRARFEPILDGCAVMDRIWSTGTSEPWEIYRVRAWEAEGDHWVEYRIDTDRGDLHRREAERIEDGWRFTEVPAAAPLDAGEGAAGDASAGRREAGSSAGSRSVRDRTVWTIRDGGDPVLVEQRSIDGGETWTELYRIELIERLGAAVGGS